MHVGRVPSGPLTAIVEDNASTYNLDRKTGGDNTSYTGSPEYNEDATSADLYLFQPTERPSMVPSGEEQQGSLQGLCLPNEDVEVEDRLTHGSAVYEVESIVGVPSDASPQILSLALTRR